jgi:uracil-DNA glycosylase
MDVKIDESWKTVLKDEFEKPYFQELAKFVKEEYQKTTVYPPPKDIFRAFNLTPFGKVEVVLLGQDPYHGDKQANGLCFAVHEGLRQPPSLQNIFKELESDLGEKPKISSELESWAKQGVLLLNATLTVRAHTAGSHQGKGWEQFTDAVIKKLSDEKDYLVFILWGNFARSKKALIDTFKHVIVESPHPSPFSAHSGFFGSKPFSKTNAYLSAHAKKPLDWL